MPEVRIDDPDLLDDLVAALRSRSDVLAEPTGPGRLRVHVIGSYGQEGERLAVYLQLRAWESAQRAAGREVAVEIVDA
jgi:hypothetical protein